MARMSPADPILHGLPTTWLAVASVFLLAGLVKGVIGLGLPTVAMGLLALWMPPAEAAALLIVPSLATNVWQLAPWRSLGPLAGRLAPMLLAVVTGTWLGAWWWGAPAGAWASVCLGGALLAYAGCGLAGRSVLLSARAQRWIGPVAGGVTGLVTAASGVFVVPAVPYLQALGLQRDALVQAMGLCFTVSTVAMAIGLQATGPPVLQAAGGSVAMLVPALAGVALGQRLRGSMSPQVFRTVLLLTMAGLGLHMLWQALG